MKKIIFIFSEYLIYETIFKLLFTYFTQFWAFIPIHLYKEATCMKMYHCLTEYGTYFSSLHKLMVTVTVTCRNKTKFSHLRDTRSLRPTNERTFHMKPTTRAQPLVSISLGVGLVTVWLHFQSSIYILLKPYPFNGFRFGDICVSTKSSNEGSLEMRSLNYIELVIRMSTCSI